MGKEDFSNIHGKDVILEQLKTVQAAQQFVNGSLTMIKAMISTESEDSTICVEDFEQETFKIEILLEELDFAFDNFPGEVMTVSVEVVFNAVKGRPRSLRGGMLHTLQRQLYGLGVERENGVIRHSFRIENRSDTEKDEEDGGGRTLAVEKGDINCLKIRIGGGVESGEDEDMSFLVPIFQVDKIRLETEQNTFTADLEM